MTLPLAVQLYSVRDDLAKDFTGVITRIAKMGYVGVETFDGMFGNTTPAAAARLLADLGLTVTSGHSAPPLGSDKNKVLDAMGAMGCQCLVIPWRPAEKFKSADQIKAVCDEINEADRVARENGLTLFYHNHWWEYEPLGNMRPYQIMLNYLERTVQLEIDTYWVRTGGSDPAAVLKQLGKRASLLHIKDGPGPSTEPMVAVGDGDMDWHTIIPAGTGAEWLIVELDRCATDMLTAVEKSYQYLVKEGFGHGK